MFMQLKQESADIYFLQETHLKDESVVKKWEKEWKGMVINSAGESNARG